MTSQQALRYHIALLLAQHGQHAVLNTFSDTLKLSHDELETLLRKLEQNQPKTGGKVRGSNRQDLVELLSSQYPEKADALRKLSARFQNKTFLSELRDVRHFLETHSRATGNLKSRADALAKVLNVLAELDTIDLRRLCESSDSDAYSSLGIISDQILGRGRE